MYLPPKPLKPLESLRLTAEEKQILTWLRRTVWEPQSDARAPIPYKTKVPQFFGGVRLYRTQEGGPSAGALGALDLFIKKLEYQGILGKQDAYPVTVENNARFLSLTKDDLDSLGVGKEREEGE